MRTRSRQHAKRDGGGGGLPRANSDPSPRSQARNQAAALPAARQPGLLAAAAAAAAGPNSLDHASSGSSSGSTGSNHVEGSLVPLVRSFSTGFLGEDGENGPDTTEDILKPLGLATSAALGLWGLWGYAWRRWETVLLPHLLELGRQAEGFSEAHPIMTDDGAEEFARSRDSWYQDITTLQENFRHRTAVLLLRDGALASPLLVLAALAVTVALSYAVVFLPDAAVLLKRDTRRVLRTVLNAVKFFRLMVWALLCSQLLAVYRLLDAASAIAVCMKSNVVELHKRQEQLTRQGKELSVYNLYAEKFAGKRWGIRLPLGLDGSCCQNPSGGDTIIAADPVHAMLSSACGNAAGGGTGCQLRADRFHLAIDSQFWGELRFNLFVGLVLACFTMFWFWSTINDARERQGKRRRGLSEKAAANVFLSRKMQEGLELIATGRRLKRLASATELDFSSLELKEQIGSGAHGVVYKGTWRAAKVEIAAKLLALPAGSALSASLTTEVAIFKELRHPHLVTCYGVCQCPPDPQVPGRLHGQLCIVTELCPYGALTSILHGRHGTGGGVVKISGSKMMKMMKGVASGMGYLHEQRIVHRDLKPANILIDKNKDVKICDYGVSKILDGQGIADADGAVACRSEIGTPDYMAPEVINGEPYDFACDLYAFGVVCNEMATRQPPWGSVADNQGRAFNIMKAVAQQAARPPLPARQATIKPAFLELVTDCWAQRPADRPTSFDEVWRRLDKLGDTFELHVPSKD